MPIVIVTDENGAPIASGPVLRCINHDTLKVQHQDVAENWTTMRAEEEYGIVFSVRPIQPGMPSVGGMPAKGQVVRAYTCKVCGYLEMYDGQVTEPGTWTPTTIAAPTPPAYAHRARSLMPEPTNEPSEGG